MYKEEEKRKELVGTVRQSIVEDDLEAAFENLTELTKGFDHLEGKPLPGKTRLAQK